jgi:putative ATP-binding cassette transporter
MDEATSALDEQGESDLYRTLIEVLPHTAIVSVGHRSSLLTFHESRIMLDGRGSWRLEAIPSLVNDRGYGDTFGPRPGGEW